MEIESEVAGEVEAPRQPFPRRNEELSSAVRCELAEMIDGSLKRTGVERLAVPDSSEVDYRRAVGPAADGPVVERL